MIPEFIPPGFIEENDPDSIHEGMLKGLPPDMDAMPGGFAWDFTRPTALEKSRLIQFHLMKTIMLMFPMWAWDEWLDYHAMIGDITRRKAKYACGKLTIEGVAGTQIPAGSVFATPATDRSPSIEFQTAQPYVIGSDGVVEIDITALKAGKNSNVTAKTITLLSRPIKGITNIYNKEQMEGGAEEEDDEELRERIQDYNELENKSFVGNDSDYKRWAKEVEDVGSVLVMPVPEKPLTVKLVIMDYKGKPAEEPILTNVYNYIMSPGDKLKRKAPIGAELLVEAPKSVKVSYQCSVILLDGYNKDEVINNFEKNLLKYYVTAKDEGELKYSKLCTALSDTEGISDFFELEVNRGCENITLQKDEYPETISVEFIIK